VALWYAKQELYVIPIEPRGKRPMGGQGIDHASIEETVIRDWYSRWPGAGVGIACEQSGWLVIDIDPRNGGDVTWSELCDGREFDTVEAITGGGGRHICFKAPDYPVKGRAGEGIDCKLRGYIVAAPSIHPCGAPYRWVKDRAPSQIAVAEIPDWLRAEIEVVHHDPAPMPDRPLFTDSDRLTEPEIAVRCLQAMGAYRADAYDTWVQVGMALHAVSDTLLPEWDVWSQQSAKYDRGACESKWRTFTAGQGGVTIATLIKLAREDGSNILLPASRAAEREAARPDKSNRDEPRPEQRPPGGDDDPLGLRCTDIANGRRFTAEYGARFRYCCDWKTWLWFDGRRWAKDDTGHAAECAKDIPRVILREALEASSEARGILAKHATRSASAGSVANALAMAQTEPGIPIMSTALNPDPWLLNLPNGTLDLRHGTMHPHEPDHLISALAGARYEPEAHLRDTREAAAWHGYLEHVTCGDADLRAWLQRWQGYCLTGDTSEEAWTFFHGIGGTGKTTLLEVFGRSMGDYCRTINMGALMKTYNTSDAKPEIVAAQHARFVKSSEVAKGQAWDEALVKTMTGGEVMSARGLYKDPVEFKPVWKLALCANDQPRVSHDDSGMWRRLREVRFNNPVTEAEKRAAMDAYGMPLKDYLLASCLPVVLAWAVEGCLTWQRQRLGTCGAVDEAVAAYRREMDPLGEWLAEVTVRPGDRSLFTGTRELYDDYCRHHREGGERGKPMSLTAFGSRIKEIVGRESRVQRMTGGLVRGFDGISLDSAALNSEGENDPFAD